MRPGVVFISILDKQSTSGVYPRLSGDYAGLGEHNSKPLKFLQQSLEVSFSYLVFSPSFLATKFPGDVDFKFIYAASTRKAIPESFSVRMLARNIVMSPCYIVLETFCCHS